MNRRPHHDERTLSPAARARRALAIAVGLALVLIQAAVLAYGDYGDETAPAPAPAAASDDQAGVSTGVFTEAQTEAGRTLFDANCAGCHGRDLGGGFGPTLNPLSADWSGQSLGSLYRFVSTNMPMDAPGTLEADEYAAVIAFVLAENGYPSGEVELPPDDEALDAFVIDEPPSRE